MSTKYSYSTDEENYHGEYDSVEAACDGATEEIEADENVVGRHFWVGEQVEPPAPESYWEADLWLEHVACQDEYSGDWADGWDGNSTNEQRAELEAEVRAVMANWLDKYDLRPKFWNIVNPRKFYVAGKVGDVYEIEAV